MCSTRYFKRPWRFMCPQNFFIYKDMTCQKLKNPKFSLWKKLENDYFLSLKKYLLPAMSCIPINLPVCSTHEYYKLVKFQAHGSFHFRDIFFSKKNCPLWASLTIIKWPPRKKSQTGVEFFFGCIWWFKSTIRLVKNLLEASDCSRSRVFTFKRLVEDKEIWSK